MMKGEASLPWKFLFDCFCVLLIHYHSYRLLDINFKNDNN